MDLQIENETSHTMIGLLCSGYEFCFVQFTILVVLEIRLVDSVPNESCSQAVYWFFNKLIDCRVRGISAEILTTIEGEAVYSFLKYYKSQSQSYLIN